LKPLVSAILGVVAGLISFGCSVVIPIRVPATDTHRRIVAGYVGLLVSTVFSIVALVAFWYYFKDSFVWFGVSLVVTYIVGLMAYFVQSVKMWKSNSGKK